MFIRVLQAIYTNSLKHREVLGKRRPYHPIFSTASWKKYWKKQEETHLGISIDGQSVTSLHFADDDVVLVGENVKKNWVNHFFTWTKK